MSLLDFHSKKRTIRILEDRLESTMNRVHYLEEQLIKLHQKHNRLLNYLNLEEIKQINVIQPKEKEKKRG